VPVTDAEALREIGTCWLDRRPSNLAAVLPALLRRRGRRLTEIGLQPRP
jgi:hypothetical protein